LFSLRLQHGYYNAGLCGALRILPTPGCQTVMRACDCRFVPGPEGGTVWAATRNGIRAADGLDGRQAFTFLITDRTAEVTKVDWQDQRPSTACLAFAAAHGAVSPPDVWPVRSHAALRDDIMRAPDLAWRIEAAQTGQTRWDHAPGDGLPELVSLAEVAEGRCQVLRGDDPGRPCVLSDVPAPDFLGFVEVFADPPAPQALDYTLEFEAVESLWRYVVQSQTAALDMSNAEIAAPSGHSFARRGPVLVRDRQAFVFESSAAIPLLHSPADGDGFALIIPPQGNRKHPPFELRHAGPAQTRAERDGDAVVLWSEMHVYL